MNAVGLNTVLQHPAVWRGDRLAETERAGLPSGFSALDQVLPGAGWPVGALTEILHEQTGIGELSLLLPAIAAQTQAGRGVVLINPPHWLYAPAWAALSVNLAQCLVVRPERANDVLWSAEQSLRSGACGLVITWPEFHRYRPDYRVLRRLQTAAETGQSSGIVFRSANVAQEASPAPLRLQLTAVEEVLQVRILKRRGALLQQAVPIVLRSFAQAEPAMLGMRAQAIVPFHPAPRAQTHLVSHY